MRTQLIFALAVAMVVAIATAATWQDFNWDFEQFSDDLGTTIGSVSEDWFDTPDEPPAIVCAAPGGGIAIGHRSGSPFAAPTFSYTYFSDLDEGGIYEFEARFFSDDPGANTQSYDHLCFYNAAGEKSFAMGIYRGGGIGVLTYHDTSTDIGRGWGSALQRWDYLKVQYTVVEGPSNDRLKVFFRSYADDPWIEHQDGELVLWHDLSLFQTNKLEAQIHPEHIGNYSFIDDISVTEIPEPTTLLLLGLGAVLVREMNKNNR